MANPKHLKILKEGITVWNKWREENPDERPDLAEADLAGAHLELAHLELADLHEADLIGAYLHGAYLIRANLGGAQLTEANLNGADLLRANLRGADLRGADLRNASCAHTLFSANDLSSVKGLETVNHIGPSTLDVDTLYISKGKIPEQFLRGCGVPDNLIDYLPSLIRSTEVIQFYSCFISYSHKDEEFARRLQSRMREDGLRVWFAPEDIKGGQKLHEQIDEVIPFYDKFLIVLSEHSLKSEWVLTELRKARKAEIRQKKRKLFPIRLVDMQTLREWECFDADTGKDLAVEVREYYIPDFSNWKDHDAFESEFAKLLEAMKREDVK